jgi:predicted alpha/beta-hydrolase family hydrolase
VTLDSFQGELHRPDTPNGDAVALTHGASSNYQAPLLKMIAESLCAFGFVVLRFNLPYRVARPSGPPSPASAVQDRRGIQQALMALRADMPGRVFAAGHSYGGRQASILAAEEAAAMDGLLLLSYPLHPPRRPDQLRIAHLPGIHVPAMFVHGTRDPFGTPDEMRGAVDLIPSRTLLKLVAGASHDLRKAAPEAIASEFSAFVRG